MDTWLIAQCMAALPHLTYFSHPESSLDDFFFGEASAIADINHRGNYSSSNRQGPAPHELQFLRSLSHSLGINPSMAMANGRATELGCCLHPGRVLSQGYFSDLASCHPGAAAKELSVGCPSESPCHYRTVREPAEISISPHSPTSVSIMPFVAAPANVRAPATSPIALHVVTCANINRSHPAQPRVATAGSPAWYQCGWEVAKAQPCGQWIEGGSKEVWTHVRTTHGLKGRYGSWCHCQWGGCLEKLKVSSLQRHLAKHLDIRWRCSSCNMVFARCDYVRRHIKLSKECCGAGCYTLNPRENDRGS